MRLTGLMAIIRIMALTGMGASLVLLLITLLLIKNGTNRFQSWRIGNESEILTILWSPAANLEIRNFNK